MLETADDAINSAVGDVVLVQDMATGLVFNGAFDPSKLVYDQSYQNEQAVSGVFKNHLGTVTQIIRRHFVDVSLIDVGSSEEHTSELQSQLRTSYAVFSFTKKHHIPLFT